MKPQEIEISIGLIKINSSYVCLKRKSLPYINFIEFPGGKKNQDESISACLTREIKEELNISLKKYKYIGFIKHLYKDVVIKINIFKIFKYHGEISSNENRDIIFYKENSSHELLPTHMKILNTLNIPRLLKIVNINNILDYRNIDLSIYKYIRLRDISYQVYVKTIKDILKATNFSGEIIIDYPYNESWQTKFHGIHFTSSNIKQYDRENYDSNYIYSASCHTAEDIDECNQRFFDFILLSPLHEMHGKHRTLGWPKFSELSLQSYNPTLALGGLSSLGCDYIECIQNHGFGLAGIRNI